MRAANDKYLTAAQSSRIRRILDAARRLLEEVGAEGMTMRDLAVASGVANATLYNRFGTKDNIIMLAVLDHYEQSIRSGMQKLAIGASPLQKLLYGIKLFESDILQVPAFARAIMSAYFKLEGSREMPDVLYKAAYGTWLPILHEMEHYGTLKPWMPIDLLCEELCDRQFAVVMKWSQGAIADRNLLNRLSLAILPVLLMASSASQALALEEEIKKGVTPKKRARTPRHAKV